MEVDARNQINLSPSHLAFHKQPMATFFTNASAPPCSGVLMVNESASVPEAFYSPWALDHTAIMANKTSMEHKADSGLTYNVQPSSALSNSRKRTRDFSANLDSFTSQYSKSSKLDFAGTPLVGDLYCHIQQQDAEIGQIITAHMHKLAVNMQERRERQQRILISSIQEGLARRLRQQDDELTKLVKLNWALQEKVDALCVENQLWRELARTNEATAISLRTNLEHVLANVGSEIQANPEDDAESCCSSSEPATNTGDSRKVKDELRHTGVCQKCVERSASVLLLPCRHLCLCTCCGSSPPTLCPVCNTLVSATVHVNLSS